MPLNAGFLQQNKYVPLVLTFLSGCRCWSGVVGALFCPEKAIEMRRFFWWLLYSHLYSLPPCFPPPLPRCFVQSEKLGFLSWWHGFVCRPSAWFGNRQYTSPKKLFLHKDGAGGGKGLVCSKEIRFTIQPTLTPAFPSRLLRSGCIGVGFMREGQSGESHRYC